MEYNVQAILVQHFVSHTGHEDASEVLTSRKVELYFSPANLGQHLGNLRIDSISICQLKRPHRLDPHKFYANIL